MKQTEKLYEQHNRMVKNVQNNKRDSRTRKVKENDCPSSKQSLLLTNLTTPTAHTGKLKKKTRLMKEVLYLSIIRFQEWIYCDRCFTCICQALRFFFHEGTEIYRLEKKIICTSVFHFRLCFVRHISDSLNIPNWPTVVWITSSWSQMFPNYVVSKDLVVIVCSNWFLFLCSLGGFQS